MVRMDPLNFVYYYFFKEIRFSGWKLKYCIDQWSSPTHFLKYWSSDPSPTRFLFFSFFIKEIVGWSHGGIVDKSKGLSLSGSSWVLLILLVGWSYFLVDPIIQSSWVLYILLKKKNGLLLHKKKSIDNKIINLEQFTLY